MGKVISVRLHFTYKQETRYVRHGADFCDLDTMKRIQLICFVYSIRR